MGPVRAPDVLALRDGADRAGRGADVVGDVPMQRLHERHRLRLVLVEAEDLGGDEDVPAAGLHRVRQDELALPGWVEQIVPRRGQLAADLLREAVGVRDESEDARIPAGPEAGGVLEFGLQRRGVRRDIHLEEAGLAEWVVELARAADEDVGLRARLLCGDPGLEVAGGRERQQVDGRARVRDFECVGERVIRGLVERGVHDDVAGRLRHRRRGGRRGRGRGGPGPAAARCECRRGGAEAHDLQECAPVVPLGGNVIQLDPSPVSARAGSESSPAYARDRWPTSRS